MSRMPARPRTMENTLGSDLNVTQQGWANMSGRDNRERGGSRKSSRPVERPPSGGLAMVFSALVDQTFNYTVDTAGNVTGDATPTVTLPESVDGMVIWFVSVGAYPSGGSYDIDVPIDSGTGELSNHPPTWAAWLRRATSNTVRVGAQWDSSGGFGNYASATLHLTHNFDTDFGTIVGPQDAGAGVTELPFAMNANTRGFDSFDLVFFVQGMRLAVT